MKCNLQVRVARFITGLLSILALASCEKETETQLSISEDGETIVTFALQVPGAAGPQVRSMTQAEENEVKTIDVLVFGPGGGTFDYTARCDASDITTGSDIRMKTFTIKLKQGHFDLVILANARNLFTPASLQGLSKADALATLEAALPASGKWQADGSAPFPMWGDVGDITIDDQTDLTGTGSVKINRMVARVDVNITGMAATTFRLTSIDVYNYNTTGTLVPDMTAWDTTSDPGRPRATAPNVPVSSTLTLGPIAYIGAEIDTDENNCMREIYLFEAENHSDAGHESPKGLQERTCLVIGGVWDANGNGNFTDDGPSTYYRIDFSTGSGTAQHFIDILRNHQYVFNITKVSGYGYEDSYTAFISRPINIETEVVAWNEADMNDIESDGRFQLTVDKSEFYFFDEGRGQSLKIYTDHPSGWKIDAGTQPSWITVSPDNDNSGTSREVIVSAGQIPSPTPNRQSSFWIVAGNLYKEIKVEQINEPELTLIIDPEYLIFRKGAPQPKPFTVTTYPAGIPVSFSEVTGDIIWRSSGFPANDPVGTGIYQFHPEVNNSNPAVQRNSSVAVTVRSGQKLLTKIVEVIQWATDLVFSYTPNNSAFVPEAGQRTITVDSDTDWYVDGIDGTTAMFASTPSSTLNAPGVTNYTVNLAANSAWQPRSARLAVKSNHIDFPGDYITVSQSAKTPVILINQSGEKDLNNGPVTATVTSNSTWTMSGDGYFNNTATATANNTGSDAPLSSVNKGSATFTRKNWTAANGIPAMGTSYTSTVTFTTTATGLPSEVNQATTSFKVRSTVQGFWTPASTLFSLASGSNISSVVTTNGAVKANTNARWTVTPSAGNPQSHNAEMYGEKTINVSIPICNNGWGNRTVTVKATNDANTTTSTATYNQKGYYVSTSGHSAPQSIAAGGGNQTVSVNGWYPGGSIQVRVLGAGTEPNTISGAAGSMNSAGNASAQVTVGANNNWNWLRRSIQFQWRYSTNTGDTGWTNIGNPVNQPGTYSNNTPTLNPTTLVGGEQTIRVTVSGTYPDEWIQVQATGTQVSVSGTTNSNKYVDLRIPNNTTGSPRNITFQYRRKDINGSWQGWITIGSAISQPKGNVVLSSGRIVALNDVSGTVNWATAMGIPTSYNSTSYPQSGVANYTTGYAVANGGCAAYSEPGYPAGTWRLPSVEELRLIYDQKESIGNFSSAGYPIYWSNTESSTNRESMARGINWNNGTYTQVLKSWPGSGSNANMARCVRNP
ncbi:MAG: hypothetical protein LUE93_15255 [Bacteroides sp.]|nr:hypothetical protein [Bacteroides sp.]